MRSTRKFLVLCAGLALAAGVMTLPAQAASYAVPKSLKATSATQTTLSLDWADVSGAPRYRVQLSRSSKLSDPTYHRFYGSEGSITGLLPATKYWFRVRVINADGTSNLSSYTGTPYPSYSTSVVVGPQGVSARPSADNTVTVSWARSEGAANYDVQRSTNANMSSAVTTRTSASELAVAQLAAGTDYWFQVRAVPASGTASSYSTAVRVTTTGIGPGGPVGPTEPDPGTPGGGAVDLRVASFNVSGVNNDPKASGSQKKWADRQPAVVDDILDEKVDVVGLQEANQSTTYYPSGSGLTQYLDLRNAVNARGAHYALANDKNYNCARFTSSSSCSYVDQGASNATRILYNTDTLTLKAQGSYKYSAQAGSTDRYLAWASLQNKANGRTFLFTTTHLQPGSSDVGVRKAQWNQLIDLVKAKRAELGNVPVIVTGDFNSSKFSDYTATLLPAMKTAGFGDVINQEYSVNPPVSPRAKVRTNWWINSFNDWRTNLNGWSYPDRRDKAGNGIDWVFATNSLEVKEWKVVIDFDPSTLAVRGTIPSDHNMVRATIVLPPPV